MFQGPSAWAFNKDCVPLFVREAAPIRVVPALYRARATVGREKQCAAPVDKKCRFGRDVRKACRFGRVCNLMIDDGR